MVWPLAVSRDGLNENAFRNRLKNQKGLMLLGGDEQYRSEEQNKSEINFLRKN